MRFRERFPEFQKALGFFSPGRLNSITDVPGVRVGHSTVLEPHRELATGVTAIWPSGDPWRFRPHAGFATLSGAGEVMGARQIEEWGTLETPILLTSTLSVGRTAAEFTDFWLERHPEIGLGDDVVLPVVAECDDSFLSRARAGAIGREQVRAALEAASEQVTEGSVGAGTGMVAFDFKGGIGTASRLVDPAWGSVFRVGVLVNANFGFARQLRLFGRWSGAGTPEAEHAPWEASRLPLRSAQQERSGILVVATDAPLRPDQLKRLASRALLGLARVGSFGGHGSGEFAIAFSTSVGAARAGSEALTATSREKAEGTLEERWMNPLFEASVEAVEEAVANALSAASPVLGRDGRAVRIFPW